MSLPVWKLQSKFCGPRFNMHHLWLSTLNLFGRIHPSRKRVCFGVQAPTEKWLTISIMSFDFSFCYFSSVKLLSRYGFPSTRHCCTTHTIFHSLRSDHKYWDVVRHVTVWYHRAMFSTDKWQFNSIISVMHSFLGWQVRVRRFEYIASLLKWAQKRHLIVMGNHNSNLKELRSRFPRRSDSRTKNLLHSKRMRSNVQFVHFDHMWHDAVGYYAFVIVIIVSR